VIENPRLPGESEAEWVARVAEAAREEAQAAHERAEAEVIKTVVSKLFEQHGDNVDRMRNIAMAIFDTLASRLGVDFEYTTAEVDDRQPEHVIDEAPTDGVTTTAEHPEVAHHE
jgi:sugar-specific transcriptional regulator TrmB